MWSILDDENIKVAKCFSLAGNYEDAADIFESIARPDSAVEGYYYLGKYETAGMILTLLSFCSITF